MSQAKKTPTQLLAIFSRCINFPRDKEGVTEFAAELTKASRESGTSMEEIVQRCRESSDRAPEYLHMLVAGRDIADERRRKLQEVSDPPWKQPIKCAICKDTGFEVFEGQKFSGVKRCPKGCEVPAVSDR